jgi:hypothetical protein
LPSQVECGRKSVMLSPVWMPMIDSLLLRTSTMDLGDIFTCSNSQVAAGSSIGFDIDGENSADRFGNGIFSVTLTGDGSRVASGSTLYGDAGRVRVFNSAELVSTEAPTIEPTAAPSIAPISASSFGPTVVPSTGATEAAMVEPTAEDSQAPSVGPTEAVTTEPTVEAISGVALAPTDVPTAASQTLAPTADTTTGAPTGAPSTSPSLSHAPSPRLPQCRLHRQWHKLWPRPHFWERLTGTLTALGILR